VSKSLLALVWIAGPLSGTLVQPYVGIKSDRCRSQFGKRRPFMLGGALATILSLMALAWTREMIGGILGAAGASEKAIATVSIVFAVLMVYILDFSINVIQAAIRAFIVDCAPSHQQDSANAWASRMSGVGNIIGYLFGYVDLPRYFWFFGDTQFKVLCVIASAAMIITLGISCLSVSERDPRLEGEPEDEEGGVIAFFKSLYHSMLKLPPQIAKVCQVQFFAWIGWFPFLFYITTYVGEIYTRPYFKANPNMSSEEVDIVWERGTRVGTYSLLIFALTTFAASVILPFMVASTYEASTPRPSTAETPDTPATPVVARPARPSRLLSRPARTPGTPGPMGAGVGGYFAMTPGTPGVRKSASGYFARTPGTPGIRRSASSYFPRTPGTPGPMGAGTGGYFARTPRTPGTPGTAEPNTPGGYFAAHPGDDDAESEEESKSRNPFRRLSIEIPWLTLRRAWLLSHLLFSLLTFLTFVVRDTTVATALVGLIGIPWAMTNWAPFALIAAEISKREGIRRGLVPPPPTADAELLASGEDPSEGADQAGVVLGIHNVAIAAPQVIATLVSSIIFKFLQKPRGVPGDDSVAWVLRFGGCAALIAAYLTRRVGEM